MTENKDKKIEAHGLSQRDKELISANNLVAPYAATFADGHADSVKPSRPKNTTTGDWWKKLIQWRRQARTKKFHRISDIAKSFPDEPIVIAISKEYLLATYIDIVEARQIVILAR